MYLHLQHSLNKYITIQEKAGTNKQYKSNQNKKFKTVRSSKV
jgi:hypothetical protein